MNSSPQHAPSRLVDLADDYKNGFIDALLYQQCVEQPTLEQIGKALAILNAYRARHARSHHDEVDIRLEQIAAIKLLRNQIVSAVESF